MQELQRFPKEFPVKEAHESTDRGQEPPDLRSLPSSLSRLPFLLWKGGGQMAEYLDIFSNFNVCNAK